MTGVELVSESLIDLALFLSVGELSLDVTASLGLSAGFIRFFNLLLVEFNVVVLQVPESEGVSINAHNSVLDESLGSDELVVGSVVNDIQNSSLARDSLRSPGEGTVSNAQGSVLHVSTTGTDVLDLSGTELGHSGHSSHLELSLFLVNRHAATSGSPLMSGVPRNTHNTN